MGVYCIDLKNGMLSCFLILFIVFPVSMDHMEREKTSTGKSRQETKYWRRRETLLNAGVSWCSVVHEAVA